jgi:hypothetical protein
MRRCASALLVAILLLPGCTPSGTSAENTLPGEAYYVDGELGFALKLPADWKRERQPAAGRVRWAPPPGAAAVTATVGTRPPEPADADPAPLLAEFTAAHPGFVLTDRQQVKTTAGGAWRLLGHTPSRLWLLLYVPGPRRSFVLEFSAPPEEFDRQRPVFERMIASFRPLE